MGKKAEAPPVERTVGNPVRDAPVPSGPAPSHLPPGLQKIFDDADADAAAAKAKKARASPPRDTSAGPDLPLTEAVNYLRTVITMLDGDFDEEARAIAKVKLVAATAVVNAACKIDQNLLTKRKLDLLPTLIDSVRREALAIQSRRLPELLPELDAVSLARLVGE